jgi:hypothetical protein
MNHSLTQVFIAGLPHLRQSILPHDNLAVANLLGSISRCDSYRTDFKSLVWQSCGRKRESNEELASALA